jgi:hypothetical protein
MRFYGLEVRRQTGWGIRLLKSFLDRAMCPPRFGEGEKGKRGKGEKAKRGKGLGKYHKRGK